MSENPELDYFMNEFVSDVVFMIEGQPLPAIKLILSLRSKVFRAMFSGKYKEEKEIDIEDTTYEAFKTFLRFLYCDDLVLKDDNDFEIIEDLCKLSDKYDVSRLMDRITDILYEKSLILLKSKENFENVWLKMQLISKIAFEYKIEKLMNKVMEFIEQNFDHFINNDNEVLNQLNDSTDGRLLTLMTKKCSEFLKDRNELKYKLDKIKEIKCVSCNVVNYFPRDHGISLQCFNCKRNYLH